MRFLVFSCLVLFVMQPVFSQIVKEKPSHYIFPEFQKGTVTMKSGVTHEAMLNYNTILEAMVISQTGSPMVILADLENVDAVVINERKFIPADKIFYEVITHKPDPYFIHYTCKVIPQGATVGFGETSQLTNTSAAAVKELAPFYQSKLPDKYDIRPQSNIIVIKDGKYHRLDHFKKVKAAFPGKEEAIKNYIKKNNTDFNSADDVRKLIVFLQ